MTTRQPDLEPTSGGTMSAIQANGLGKRYRRDWALRDVTLSLPSGRIAALVGPNGAGKTTLLHLAVGLVQPTTGALSVLGDLPAGSPEALEAVGFVAQDTPLYGQLRVGAMVEVANGLNSGFDTAFTLRRLAELRLPLARKVAKLSGGQQAQLALALALGRHPRLLLLDEPLARLDPVARHDFMGVVMAATASDGVSVVFSSHVVSELERVADFLVLLNDGRIQLTGDIDELLANHRMLVGPPDALAHPGRCFEVVHSIVSPRLSQLLVRVLESDADLPDGCSAEPVTLEELVLGYLREHPAGSFPTVEPRALISLPGGNDPEGASGARASAVQR